MLRPSSHSNGWLWQAQVLWCCIHGLWLLLLLLLLLLLPLLLVVVV
jgi:hypothetical protein